MATGETPSGRGTAVSEPALGIVQAAKVASVQAQAGALILDGRRPHSLGWQHSTAQVFQKSVQSISRNDRCLHPRAHRYPRTLD